MTPTRAAAQLAPLALALALASGLGCQRGEQIPGGNVAASLVAPTLGDAVFDPATLHGKPALVLFVSPTCAHCLAELPRAQAIAKAADAHVVAVFVAGNGDAASEVVQRTKFAGTVLVDDGTLRRQYNVTQVPYTLVLDRDGSAHAALLGEQDDGALRDALAAI